MDKKLVKAKALKEGDTVGLIGPAGPYDTYELRRGLETLAELGLQVKLPEGINARWRYMAGEDALRVQGVLQMLNDARARGVLCTRGGYGSLRLIPFLDEDKLLKKGPKVVIGASDTTTLLLYLHAKYGLVTFHGPMVATEQFGQMSPLTHHHFVRAVMQKSPIGEITLERVKVLRGGVGEGPLIGGCLSLVVASLGTSFEVDTRGKILFLEDVNEPPYRIDRMLTHLKLAGKFARAKGILFGEMPGCHPEPDEGFTLEDVILDVLKDVKVPILFNFPVGHGRDHITLPLGVKTLVDGARGSVVIEEAAVL